MRWFLPASVVALFAARFCAGAMRGPPADGDLAWQAWLGARILSAGKLPVGLGAETFSAAGSPWLPQEWLFSLATAIAQRFGIASALYLAVALCGVLALAIVARRAAAGGASPLGTTLCVLFAGIAMVDSFGVRAQVAGWSFVSLFTSLLESEASWVLCAALVVLWANVHAGAVIAPVLACAWSIGLAVRDRRAGLDVVRAATTSVAVAVAVGLNPFGFGLVAYAAALVRSPIKDFIREWQPTSFADASFVWGALPLLAGVAVWALFEGRRAPQRLCVTAVGLALMASAARNIPVFALIAAPYAALGFARVLRRIGLAGDAPRPRLAAAAAACFVLLAGVTGFRLWRAPAPENGTVDLIDRLAGLPGSHRLLCQDYAWCGAAVGKPGIRVFLDGRADPYPPRVWTAAFRVAHRSAGWQDDLRQFGVDSIIAERSTRLGAALGRSERWHASAIAGQYVLFVRSAARSRRDTSFMGV